jgi:diguanylate cyclase (GGDEF)-like protein/PAS domain S-box-containing protein
MHVDLELPICADSIADLEAVLAVERERRTAAEERLAQLSLALDATDVGVWDWNLATGDVWLSDMALALQGYAPGEVRTNVAGFRSVIHPDDYEAFARLLRRCLRGDLPLIRSEHRLTHKRGGWVWVQERARVAARDENGRALRVIGTRLDVTERRAADERLRWLAEHDPLTGLYNRAYFQDALTLRLEEEGSGTGLLLIDLDRFKHVNDSHGHDAGDALLRAVAQELARAFPKPAAAARYGGDEFAILIPDSSWGALGEAASLARHAVHLAGAAASVGVALAERDCLTTECLLKQADVDLYRHKRAQRGSLTLSGG